MKINKKPLILALVIAAGIATVATTRVRASVDTQLLALMPPDSQILAGARADQAVMSPFGQFILSKMNAAPDELKAKTGFDIRTDLREVLVAPVSKFGAALGRFPVAQLETILTQQGQAIEDYKGFRLIGTGLEKSVFLDGSTVLVGSADAVRPAIDRWIAHAQAPSNEMTAKVFQVSATSQAWVAATNLSAIQNLIGPQDGPQADIARNILNKMSGFSGQITLPPTGGVSVQGQVVATSAQDAQTLYDAYNALKLLAPAEATNNPVFSGIQVSVNGSAINTSLLLTEQQVEGFTH
jgi:hypothetical protein